MIQVVFARHWFTVVAITVKDDRTVEIAFGLTEGQALRRLLKED